MHENTIKYEVAFRTVTSYKPFDLKSKMLKYRAKFKM